MTDGKVTNALTVDVEDYFHVSAFANDIKSSQWRDFESRVELNTDRLLRIFDDASVSATFFVLGWVAEHYPAVVSRIAQCGHEIACHGYSHQLIYKQSPETFLAETIKAREILESLSSTPVRGYRAASFSITADSLWAIECLVNAGFEYDSSIVPVRHDLYGLVGARERIYQLQLVDGRRLTEFPPATTRILGVQLPNGGGGYFRLYPYWFTKWSLERINKESGRPFSFYLHPWEIDPEQPRLPTNLKSRFRHYNNLEKCQDRLEKLLEDFKFGPMGTILDQWVDEKSKNESPVLLELNAVGQPG